MLEIGSFLGHRITFINIKKTRKMEVEVKNEVKDEAAETKDQERDEEISEEKDKEKEDKKEEKDDKKGEEERQRLAEELDKANKRDTEGPSLSSNTRYRNSKGSSESVQEFAARINKLGTQIFQSGNSAQNTAVRNANDQLLQSRFISGFRNDIRRFVLARDPINLDESINAALIEEQNVNINQIANDERSVLSPSQTETSVISALTNKLQEINLRVERLQEASSVTVRKTGGVPFSRRETVFKCFIVAFKDIGRRSVGKSGWTNVEPITSPRRDAAGEFSVFRHPSSHSFDRRHVHFQESAFRDNYAAPRHSASGSHTTSRNRGFQRNTRNNNLNFRGERRI
ncbi:hypothetical protein TNCV_242491 [Trichonephila clavipes]|uniref:Uncharacterized protein n=1 Tax=Trichonephila clavipes TaxID=2585209 RepID=A0A8X7BDU6_TRICX|nr:hypothetical protein TNCV_242491 [Trichonephila clavipes]